jgi:murein DD-endopeptidase MepM/ murein hydrolase activator NlpD
VVPNRWTAAGAVSVLAAAVSVPALTAFGADEDELKHRRSAVTDRLQDVRGDLAHSSKRLAGAVQRLRAAQAELADAQAHLDHTRARLQQAIAFDQMMQQRLDAARARLAGARAELAAGQQAVARQRDRLAAFAADSFQSGQNRFLELRVFLKTETPASLSTRMEAVDSIASRQSASFARLRASEVLLTVHEEEVEAAKRSVAAKRAAAARNLDRKEQLEAEAQAAQEHVSALVAARATAREQAQEARQADLEQVQALESEREDISDRLAELAERRAEALERAREQAAQAQQQAEDTAETVSGLIYPVSSYITSSYGMRVHPIYGYYDLHDGTDFGAGCGTPVRAADSGRVLSAYYSTGYGNQVLIDHGIESGVSLSTSYNHLNSYAVSAGESVSQGEVIGYVGSTGYSTGCHLHFMVYEGGDTVDPMSWL